MMISPGVSLNVQLDIDKKAGREEYLTFPNTAEGRGRLSVLIKESGENVSFSKRLRWFDQDDLQLLAMVRLAQTDE